MFSAPFVALWTLNSFPPTMAGYTALPLGGSVSTAHLDTAYAPSRGHRRSQSEVAFDRNREFGDDIALLDRGIDGAAACI